MKPIEFRWLGRQPYGPTLEEQRDRRAAVIAGTQPEALWLLEHEPTITTGRRAVEDIPPMAMLEARGIAQHQTERGGLATYHGPGQLVAYAIINCWDRGLGAKTAVATMEQGILDWLHTLGIDGHRRDGFPGIWIGNDKIAAIGMHFKRGVSMHGVAINVASDLSGFDLITPCGIVDGGVTSIEEHTGQPTSLNDAATALADHLLKNLQDPPCLRQCQAATP